MRLGEVKSLPKRIDYEWQKKDGSQVFTPTPVSGTLHRTAPCSARVCEVRWPASRDSHARRLSSAIHRDPQAVVSCGSTCLRSPDIGLDMISLAPSFSQDSPAT